MSQKGSNIRNKKSGKNMTNQNLVVDESHTKDGYFSARSNNSNKQKLRVIKDGYTLTYDISNTFENFPLQLGNGQYQIQLYKNVSGRRYVPDGKIIINVSLQHELAPYLHSNQYVKYDNTSPYVQEALKYAGFSDSTKIKLIKEYISDNYIYDYVRSLLVEDGELPDIQRCFEKKMGICQDLAALTAAMFRTVGIPCQLVIGYTEKNQYHAWNEIYNGKVWEIFDPTMAVNNDKRNKKYSKERWY